MIKELEEILEQARLYLARKAPFFATLAFYAPVEISEEIETAATDGVRILFNPNFTAQLQPKEIIGLYLHEVLHIALQHNQRRKHRNPLVWNIACDYIINGEIIRAGFSLPKGRLINEQYWDYSSEELYEILFKEELEQGKQKGKGESGNNYSNKGLKEQDWGKGDILEPQKDLGEKELKQWQKRIYTAASLNAERPGDQTAGKSVEFQIFKKEHPDWRKELWEFCAVFPADFTTYDRRFIHTGLYIDHLDGYQLSLFVCVDTSASISQELLNAFMTEILAIQKAYDFVEQFVFFCDTKLVGPIKIEDETELANLIPKGRGGTSFYPIFRWIREYQEGRQKEFHHHINNQLLLIYLTDGYADFPTNFQDEFPVLWVRAPKGIPEESFPFGKVISIQ